MTPDTFDSAESWSVECDDLAYDDARKIDNVWYFRDEVTGEIHRFEFQSHVVPLYKNSPGRSAGM